MVVALYLQWELNPDKKRRNSVYKRSTGVEWKRVVKGRKECGRRKDVVLKRFAARRMIVHQDEPS